MLAGMYEVAGRVPRVRSLPVARAPYAHKRVWQSEGLCVGELERTWKTGEII